MPENHDLKIEQADFQVEFDIFVKMQKLALGMLQKNHGLNM